MIYGTNVYVLSSPWLVDRARNKIMTLNVDLDLSEVAITTPQIHSVYTRRIRNTRNVVATFTPRRSHISGARFTRSLLLASRLPAGCRSAPRYRYRPPFVIVRGFVVKSLLFTYKWIGLGSGGASWVG